MYSNLTYQDCGMLMSFKEALMPRAYRKDRSNANYRLPRRQQLRWACTSQREQLMPCWMKCQILSGFSGGEWSCLNQEGLLLNRILPWFEVHPGDQFLLGFQHCLHRGCQYETGCGCSPQSPHQKKSEYVSGSAWSYQLLALQERTRVRLRKGGSSQAQTKYHGTQICVAE